MKMLRNYLNKIGRPPHIRFITYRQTDYDECHVFGYNINTQERETYYFIYNTIMELGIVQIWNEIKMDNCLMKKFQIGHGSMCMNNYSQLLTITLTITTTKFHTFHFKRV